MPPPYPHPLTIPDFRAYWLSRLAGTVAATALAIVIGWQVYGLARQTMDIREAAFLLGMIGAAQFVPLFLLTPVVGLVADSVDRRWIVRATTALMMIVVAVLGILTWRDALTLPALFGAAVFIGIARAFSGPAYSALAPNLVPREVLPTAIAVSSIAWQVGSIAGPSVGGLLFAIHPDVAYATIAALLAVALVGIFLIGPVAQPAVQKDHRVLARIVDGFGYVRRNRLVLATITLDLFVVLLAGATALLPIYARDILHVGAAGLGFLAAGMGIGAATTAVWFSVRPMRENVGVKMLAAVIVFAVAILAFGLSTNFWLSLVALIVAGAADMVSVYVRSSLIQLHTPDHMRGRVSAVSQLTISASNELGEAESGLLASLLGPVGAVVFGAGAAIVITLAWSRLFPELRLAKTFDPPEMPTDLIAARSDEAMKANTILDTIGNTPHIRVQKLFPGSEVWIKSERSNPGGSIKDRIALAMVEAAEASGDLKPGGTIIEPTSGNTGIGLALVAAVKGYKLVLVMPESMSLERRRLMLAYGASFDLTPREKGMKGAIERAIELVGQTPDSWMPQQFDNPANIDIHVKTTAQEILNDFRETPIDVLITGVGTGGHITGVAETLKRHWPQLKVYAVEPAASPVIGGGQPGPHPIQGIGAGFVPSNLHTEALDGVIEVDAAVAKDMARRAAREEGMLVGISSGATLAAILQKLPDLPDDARVLGFNYDTGERYLSVPDFLPEA